ncbi:glycosyltransferase [Metabacillus litoralis]|uniref:4,4'-diaponeurosporenoate glycosyltransferase n=2 Tax=Metabacillus litoralis TaxID=152268 RepID=A0A5C6VQE6_9BACI|nr:glycosyltransferase [Metabacillus litoralis]
MMIAGILAISLFLILCYHVPKIKLENLENVESALKSLSIIIPARNEEETIRTILNSIKSQADQPLEIIVVDDHSSDQTKNIALEYNVKVVDNPPLPQGWLGKSWACWNGARVAKGDYLMFVDADTWFAPNGLKKAISFFESSKYEIITIHPYHHMNKFYEKFSSFFHLIVFISSGVTTLLSKRLIKKGGFGQSLLCKRTSYFAIGGHESIKGEVVENLAFVQHASARNNSVYAVGGYDVINMRMYHNGISSVFKGWGKSFASGSKKTQPVLMIFIVLWISSLFTFLTNSFTIIVDNPYIFLIIYSTISFLFYKMLKVIGNFTILDAFLFPLHILFFLAVFCFSLFKTYVLKNTSWKGRTIIMTKHGDDQEL